MTHRTNLKQQLSLGQPAFGAWCMIPSAVTAELAARTGFDFICLDTQHGLLGYETTLAMLQAIDLGPALPIVRVRANDPAEIGRMLDAGAMGVIVPLINNAAQARAAVAACRYPPEGWRSFGPTRVGLREGGRYFERANREVLVVAMIETAEALRELEEIAAVAGIDALFVGPYDLSVSLGLAPAEQDESPIFNDAIRRVLTGCRSAGVVPGILSDSQHIARHLEQGFLMLPVTMDIATLGNALRADLATARQHRPERAQGSAGSGNGEPC